MRKDASTPLLGSQDFCGYQGRNLRIENSSVAPSNLGLGGIYYNTGDHLLYYNKNSVWTTVGVGTTTGSGTTGTLSKWTSSTALGDSVLTESGSYVTSTLPIKIVGSNTGVYFSYATVVQGSLTYDNAVSSIILSSHSFVDLHLYAGSASELNIIDGGDMTFVVDTGGKFTFTVL
jgi:hypothetical protein